MKHIHLLAACILGTAANSLVQAQPNWFNNALPLEAVTGGHDSKGNGIYVCRSSINGHGPYPGWSASPSDGCHIGNPDTGKEVITSIIGSQFLITIWSRIYSGANYVFYQNALLAGVDSSGVSWYYCRAPYSNSLLVGRLKGGTAQCVVPYVNGASRQEMTLTGSVDVLMRTQPGLTETPTLPLTTAAVTIADDVPADTIVGGKDSLTAKSLYVCSVNYKNGPVPGVLRKGEGCYITDNNHQVLNFPSYSVVVPIWVPNSRLLITQPDYYFSVGSDQKGNRLYVCRGSDSLGGLRAGSTTIQSITQAAQCHIGYGGSVLYDGVYDLLSNTLPRIVVN